MGRKTNINQEEVNQICKKLRTEGYRPTVDRLMAELGRGSRTTINLFLRKFLEEESESTKNIQLIIPDKIHAIFHNLVGEINATYDEKISILETSLADKSRDVDHYMDESQKNLEKIELHIGRIEELEQNNGILKSENESLKKNNLELTEKYEKTLETAIEAKILKKTNDSLQTKIEKLTLKNQELIIENAGLKKELELKKSNTKKKN